MRVAPATPNGSRKSPTPGMRRRAAVATPKPRTAGKFARMNTEAIADALTALGQRIIEEIVGGEHAGHEELERHGDDPGRRKQEGHDREDGEDRQADGERGEA